MLSTARDARADLTGFIGRTYTPVGRPVEGFGVGTGLVIVGFEFEYSSTQEDLTTPGTPGSALKTYMFNGLLQTPFPIARMQFYATAGGGVYHETLSTEPGNNQTNFGTNIGGGAKISLIGPLRLRVDYRVFTLKGTPRNSPVQRIYAGLNIKF
jgi:hypothetical protein